MVCYFLPKIKRRRPANPTISQIPSSRLGGLPDHFARILSNTNGSAPPPCRQTPEILPFSSFP
jgi:hypothetical protein